MGARKPGDKYNYEIAAFLKTNKVDYSSLTSPLNFTSLHFNPNPKPIFSEVFKLKISIDLLASDSSTEFIFECKHQDQPKPFTVTSPEFKESLLEFIALEGYRLKQFRNVAYVLVTNVPKKQLETEILNLKITPELWPEYLKKLVEQAKKKWATFNSKITKKSFLNALNNLMVIQIENSILESKRKTKDFQEALLQIIEDIDIRELNFIPVNLSNENEIWLQVKTGEAMLETKVINLTIKVSAAIVDQLVEVQKTLNNNLVRVDSARLPFLNTSGVISSQNIGFDIIALRITEAINNLLEEKAETNYIVLFYPGQYDIYFADKKWAFKTIESLRSDTTGLFSLIDEPKIPPYVSIFLIKETKRLLEGIAIDIKKIKGATDFEQRSISQEP